MRITPADEARAIALLTKDVDVTLGPAHETLIQQEAAMRRRLYNEPDAVERTATEYIESVVEEVQQYFHDCFVDITWPECPLHRRHPLWVHDGYWTCEQSRIRVAGVGQLRTSHEPTGRYLILADLDLGPAD